MGLGTALALSLLLAGCAPTSYSIIQVSYFKRLHLVEDARKVCRDRYGYKDADACSFVAKGYCDVYISKKDYPRWVEHEERHCVEGAWHR